MTVTPPKPAVKTAPVVPVKKKPPAPPGSMAVKKKSGFPSSGQVNVDIIANADAEHDRLRRLQSMVFSQTVVIVVLAVSLVFLSPVLKPIYHYYAYDPDGNVSTLDPLIMPNMTDHAVLSWAVTSV